MPKEFPQIRINAETEKGKQQAVSHVKRGMLELFKTQAWQESAGIPITKRTVEVDPSTSITVQVTKEQTFIDITSTGEEVTYEEEEEVVEQDIYKCPAGFIIRKFDPVSKKIGGYVDSDREQGYIIAYNHSKSEWQVAQYQDATGSGNTFPKASNIGWWHAPNKKAYTSCDVITWYGQSHFDFSGLINPSYSPENYGLRTMLTGSFFFKGREFRVGGDLLGACIIDVAGVDYVYALSLFPLTSASTKKFSLLYSRRMTMSALLSGSEDWEVVKTLSYADFGFDDDSGDYWDYPASTAHIDKDGYAYIVLTHRDYIKAGDYPLTGTLTPYDGVTEFLKFNMRDLSYETINSSRDCIPVCEITGEIYDTQVTVGGGYGWCNDSGSFQHGQYAYSNVGKPWTFYALGGTKDLWSFALEWDANASRSITTSGDWFGSASDYTCTGDAYLNCTMIVYKNLKEHERIQVLGRSGQTQCDYHRSDPYPRNAVFNVAEASIMEKTIIEYHPEIPDSLRYTQCDIGPGGYAVTYTLNEGSRTVDTILDNVPLRFDADYSVDNPPSFYGSYYSPPLQAGADVQRFGLTLEGTDGTIQWTQYFPNVVLRNSNSTRQLLTEYTAMHGHNTQLLGGAVGHQKGGGGPGGLRGNAVGSIGTRSDDAHLWMAEYGSNEGWWYPKEEGIATLIPSEGFAVHRPTDTGKGTKSPYLYMKRKIRLCKQQEDGEGGDWYYPSDFGGVIRLASTDPRTHDPLQPAEYNQRTVNSGGPGTYSRRHWWMWTEPLGYHQQVDYDKNDPDMELEHQWNDSDWELKSNVLTKKQLNQMTKDSDNAFFEIAVL